MSWKLSSTTVTWSFSSTYSVGPADVEERLHLVVVVDRQRVHLARRLEDVGALVRHPRVLEVAPAALEHEAVHRARVAVAAEHAAAAHAQHLAVAARVHVEVQGARPHVRLQLDPDALVVDVGGTTSSGAHPEMAEERRVGQGVGVARHDDAHGGPPVRPAREGWS